MTRSTRIILIAAALIIIAIGAYFAWKSRTGEQPVVVDDNTSVATTTVAATTTPATNTTSTDTTLPDLGPGYTVTPIDIPKAPDFSAPLTFSASVSASMRTSLAAQFADVQKALKEDEANFSAWVTLGVLHKQAGNYARAETMWKYASANWPANPVAHANLADLYTHHLRDYPKAAAAYQSAIANDPARAQLYQDLYDLYTGPYPQSTASIETLLKASITKLPKEYQLQVQLARYYVATNNPTAAKVQYDAAIANAKSQYKTAIAAEIEAEKSRI